MKIIKHTQMTPKYTTESNNKITPPDTPSPLHGGASVHKTNIHKRSSVYLQRKKEFRTENKVKFRSEEKNRLKNGTRNHTPCDSSAVMVSESGLSLAIRPCELLLSRVALCIPRGVPVGTRERVLPALELFATQAGSSKGAIPRSRV